MVLNFLEFIFVWGDKGILFDFFFLVVFIFCFGLFNFSFLVFNLLVFKKLLVGKRGLLFGIRMEERYKMMIFGSGLVNYDRIA